MKDHEEESKEVLTPWGYATLLEKSPHRAKVEFSWGGIGYLNPSILAFSISIQVKTFTKDRRTLSFDWKLDKNFNSLFSEVSSQLDLPSYAYLQLYYPMGTMKEVTPSDSPFSLKLSGKSKLIGVVRQNFFWDENKKGTNIEISNSGLTAFKKSEEEFETVLGNVCLSSGSYYWDVKIDMFVDDEDVYIGVAQENIALYTRPPDSGAFWGYMCTGGKKFAPQSSIEDYAEPARTGDVIGVKLEFSGPTGVLTFSKNGRSYGPAFDNVPPNVYPAICLFYYRAQVTLDYKL
mmetsp:Transcript_1581/g.2556  ORF Transcript_1581/g.2556 Transcript_1581/m.2556 type:complete len:290 (-) Transcript_1581:2116-2985(-)